MLSKRAITLCKIILQLIIITKKIYAIIGGLKSGGLKSGGLKSGGLMSSGLKSGGLMSGGLKSGVLKSGGLMSGWLNCLKSAYPSENRPVLHMCVRVIVPSGPI